MTTPVRSYVYKYHVILQSHVWWGTSLIYKMAARWNKTRLTNTLTLSTHSSTKHQPWKTQVTCTT